jgi:serine/threonine protein kinase
MLIANKYEIIDKINEGQFGIIVKGRNIRTGQYVAIKIEPNNTNTLKMEAKIYQYLGKLDGFPHLKWYGISNNHSYLVLDLLTHSLVDLVKICGKLVLPQILNIGIQMFQRIKSLHNKYLIHRDIKPNNFMIKYFTPLEFKNADLSAFYQSHTKGNNYQGYLNSQWCKIYLIDFGMCKRYETNGKHIICNKIQKIIGTPNFVSLNIHNGYEPSRRDDIESIIYILIYLYFGNIIWNQEKSLENMKFIKSELTNNENIPTFIKILLNYVRELKFSEKPNYDYLINILEQEI